MFEIPEISKQFPKLGEVVGNIMLIVQILRLFPWQFFEDFKGFFSVFTRLFTLPFPIKGPAEGLEDFTLRPDVRNVPWLFPNFFFQGFEGFQEGFFSFLDVPYFLVQVPKIGRAHV